MDATSIAEALAAAERGDLQAALALEREIERRGLQTHYIYVLLPAYHSFEAFTPAELLQILRTPAEQRGLAARHVLQEPEHGHS